MAAASPRGAQEGHGTIADAQDTVAEVGARLFELFIQTASGRQTSSELLGFGDDDFVPWQTGIVT